jgi:hypothetical protein
MCSWHYAQQQGVWQASIRSIAALIFLDCCTRLFAVEQQSQLHQLTRTQLI